MACVKHFALNSMEDERFEVDVSVDEHALPQSEVQDRTSQHLIWPICLAVVASGVVIALLGVSPLFIVLAPFLSIASAAVIGLLFFIEPHLD